MKRIIISFFLGIMIIPTVGAQIDEDTTTLTVDTTLFPTVSEPNAELSREMLLEREFNPTLRDAIKVGGIPELSEPRPINAKVEYSNYSAPYSFRPLPSNIQPQTWLKDLKMSQYKGYAKIGILTLPGLDADAGYRVLNTSTTFLDVYASHHSDLSSKRTLLQGDGLSQKFGFNDTWFGANFSHELEKFRLNAAAQYTHSSFNHSELMLDTTGLEFGLSGITPENQKISIIDIKAGIENQRENTINYAVNLSYSIFSQKRGQFDSIPGASENRLVIDWNVHKDVFSDSGFGIAGYLKNFSYSPDTVFQSYEDSLLTGYSIISINPYYYLEGYDFNLKAGLKFDFETGWNNTANISPEIRFNWFTLKDKINLYAITTGGIRENSLKSMFYENRYAAPNVRIKDSRTMVDVTVGAKYMPITELYVNLFAGLELNNDEHYFLPFIDTLGMSLKPIYGNETTVKFGACAKYSYNVLDLELQTVYYSRSVKATDDYTALADEFYTVPWFKPSLELTFRAGYKFSNLPLQIDLAYRGGFGRKSTVVNTYNPAYHTEDDASSINDLSLKGLYKIKPNLTAFASFNNLMFQNYDIYYGYPAQQFNMGVGVSYLF